MLDVYPLAFYADNALDGKVNGVSWFSSGGARKAVAGGFADYIPNYYRDTIKLIRENYEYDAFCIAVSPMDKHGYFSLATTSSYSEGMISKAKRIFVEVNDFQPRSLCNTQLHISQIDAIVENSHPLPVLPPTKLDETSITIGNLIAEQIPDGACIQLGIGAIPDAVGMALKTKHDLGIHTEMFTDSMVELIECGAVNNSKKQMGLAGDALDFLELPGFPTTLLIDRNGTVGLIKVGAFSDKADFESKVSHFLSPDYDGKPLKTEKAVSITLYLYGWILISGLLMIVGRWGILRKAGKKGWHSLIPLLNVYKEYSTVWNGWFGVLAALSILRYRWECPAYSTPRR